MNKEQTKLKPEDTKNISEGAGKLLTAIGKEVDEHDVGGKLAAAKAFSLKADAIFKFVFLAIWALAFFGGIIFFIWVNVNGR